MRGLRRDDGKLEQRLGADLSFDRRTGQKCGVDLRPNRTREIGSVPGAKRLRRGLCQRTATGSGGLSGEALRLESLPIVISGLLRFFIFRRFGLRRLECLVGLQHCSARGFFLKHRFSYLECRCPAFRLMIVAACCAGMTEALA